MRDQQDAVDASCCTTLALLGVMTVPGLWLVRRLVRQPMQSFVEVV